MKHDDPKKTDPAMDELLGSLRSLFETERERLEESRAIDAGQADMRVHLVRLETRLEQVLDGLTRLNRRLDALEAQRHGAVRVEELLLRLLGTDPTQLH